MPVVMTDCGLAEIGITQSPAHDLPTQPTVASFFAGIGGFELGFEQAGFETVWQCEVKPFCLEILEQHWPAVPKRPTYERWYTMTFQKQLFGPEDSPARTSASPEWDQGAGSTEHSQGCSSSLRGSLEIVAPRLSSSKTLEASSLPTKDEILQLSFGRWPNSGMAWRGECLTVVTSESPKAAIESSLSDLLEDQQVPDQYFLSSNAATGMLRRAKRMGRNLFPPLRSALEILSKGM